MYHAGKVDLSTKTYDKEFRRLEASCNSKRGKFIILRMKKYTIVGEMVNNKLMDPRMSDWEPISIHGRGEDRDRRGDDDDDGNDEEG